MQLRGYGQGWVGKAFYGLSTAKERVSGGKIILKKIRDGCRKGWEEYDNFVRKKLVGGVSCWGVNVFDVRLCNIKPDIVEEVGGFLDPKVLTKGSQGTGAAWH